MKSFLYFLLFCFSAANIFAKDINSLYPYPKAAWSKLGQFTIANTTKLVIPDSPTPSEMTAIAALQTVIQKQAGYKLAVTSSANYSGSGGIIIGEFSNSFLQNRLQSVIPRGETMPSAQGYILDITQKEILIVGSDTEGTYNAVVSFSQLLNKSGSTLIVNAAHVWDYPDYPVRWIFSSHNLLVSQQLSALEVLADTMALYKLNGIQQNDFKYAILQIMGSNYFKNVDSLKSHLLKQNIEVIPGVVGLGWSSGILYNDPNLAEGLPAAATYFMESDTARPISNPQTVIANGDFESVSNNQFSGWNGAGSFYDGPNISAFVDHSVFHGGSTSAKCTSFTQGNPSGNCRFSKLVNCDSNKSYSLSAWIKTQDLQGGYAQLLALGGVSGQSLTFTSLSIPSTTDWTRVEVNFNSLGNTSIRLYVGVWGGVSGTIWFDDFAIKEAGLSSVLRRGGCPLSAVNKKTGQVYTENIDYLKVVDPWVDSHKDSYFPCHTPPTFKRITAGAIKNGDSVIIKYYHPFAAVSDNTGNGSVMACVSEDTLYKILGDQITRVNDLYHPNSFFMGHDEIRNMNHDKICTDRHISPASQLADNMTKCHDLITSISKSADVLMWSDMVDSLHNAYNNYYLINGDLSGDWNNIPKDITIVNWNGGNAKSSLQFFEHYGFKQISSPYYDVGNTSTIRSWRIAQEGVSNVRGMMYTTWNNDYNFIRPFAYYAWGAGPNIIHTPLDTTVLSSVSFQIDAQIIKDPFDNNDAITSVKATIEDSIGNILVTLSLINSGGNTYSVAVPNLYQNGFQYFISAVNKQGISRILPTYIIKPSVQTKDVANSSFLNPLLSNYPNPLSSETTVDFMIPKPGIVTLRLLNILGDEIRTVFSEYLESGLHHYTLKLSDLPNGTYIYEMKTPDGVISNQMKIVR